MDAEAAQSRVAEFAQPALDARTIRAIEEYMVVLPIGTGEAGLYRVFSESGREYQVSLPDERCECPDYAKRGAYCKHQRRARLKHDGQWRSTVGAGAADTIADIDERIAELEAQLADLRAVKREYQSLLGRLEDLGPAVVDTAAGPTGQAATVPGDD